MICGAAVPYFAFLANALLVSMSRLARLAIGGHPHLVLLRGLRSQPLFVDDDDRRLFLAKLADAAVASKVVLHAYVLLDFEVQLLATPEHAAGLSRMMQSVGRSYVAAFNRRHTRLGTLWQGRYRAAVIEAANWLIDCMRHVEAAPLRFGHPTAVDYEWSSAAHHVGRRADPLITDHPMYWRLGNTPFDREARYRELLEQALTPKEAERIEHASAQGWALGSERFLQEIGQATTRRLRPMARGRPALVRGN
jgi:putative transposase